jgi:LPXTG-site transpeptidase (sortase) family protein
MHKTPLLLKVVSLYVAIGIPFFAYQAIVSSDIAQPSAQHLSAPVLVEPTEIKKPIIVGHPKQILIPRLNVNLPIFDGVYDPATQSWTLGNQGVHYAYNTNLPNDDHGNTLLYGHNNPKILGVTKHLQPGDELIVITDNNLTFTYMYTEDQVVEPSNTTLFEGNHYELPRLTLLTCSGTWSQNRRLMNFQFVEVK